ncbi:hypothetical protein DRP04_15185 [Archaeoglobales archaeon]|nr:MAG: hypothetical protein DRP04_15185 [Archaeoglobales archaeon]
MDIIVELPKGGKSYKQILKLAEKFEKDLNIRLAGIYYRIERSIMNRTMATSVVIAFYLDNQQEDRLEKIKEYFEEYRKSLGSDWIFVRVYVCKYL